MKKCVLVLVFFVAVSCHHIYDPEPEPDPVVPAEVTFLDCFVGHKWVYDHPDIPTWEEWNVFDDGVMYYSNSTSFVYQFTNTDVKCRYTYNYENGSFLVQTEKLGVIEGIISQWDEYAFSWKTMDGTFEYGRVLESVNIINGSAYLPSYSTLVSDATISAFSSHQLWQ